MADILLGTRGSRLALAQTEQVAGALRAAKPGLDVAHDVIQTSGDWAPAHGEQRLSEAAGGKGLFIKEIEQALMGGRVHAGVHSLKDVPTFLPESLAVDHFITREDPRDVLISRDGVRFDALPKGAVVGTASVRRQALLLHHRPDLVVVPLRGNVTTRLDKLMQGQVDAIVLAAAGLQRIGLSHVVTEAFSTDFMLPACGQGIVAMETRADDAATRAVLDCVSDPVTACLAAAERQVLTVLEGSCRAPISAFAEYTDDGFFVLRGAVASLDGAVVRFAKRRSQQPNSAQIHDLATSLAHELKDAVPPAILAS